MDFMLKPHLLLVAAAVGLSAVPAVAQSSCQTVQREAEAPARNPRRHAADSTRLALRDQIGDTLRARFRAAAVEWGVAEPVGLVVVEIRDRRRGTAEVTPHASNVSYTALQGVVDREAALLATWPERDGVFNLRLEHVERPYPEDAAEWVECRPSLADPNRLQRDLVTLSSLQGPLPAGSNPRVVLHVRMLVTRDGEVAYARLSRRGFRPGLDEGVLELARRQRFVPATVNGRPVDVWVEQPFHFMLRVDRG